MTFLLALVLVGWDGALFPVVQEMLKAGELPNVSRLVSFGELEIMGCATQTKPVWTTVGTGLKCGSHGTLDNQTFMPAPAGKTLPEYLHSLGARTGWIVGKPNQIGSLPGYPFERVSAAADVYVADDTLSIEVEGDLCLTTAPTVDFLFCHFRQPDFAGHKFGGGSWEYRDKIRRLDTQLGRMLDAGLNVLLVSDHGFEVLPLPEGYEDPVWPVRRLDLGKTPGYAHIRQPRAIIGSTVTLDLTRPTELDVFKTVLGMMGAPVAPWALEGRSLLR